MLDVYLYTFISVFLISLVSLLGVFTLSIRTDLLKKYIYIFISVAVGALLGDAFIHLLPEAYTEFSNSITASLLVIAGIIIFFILEKLLHWHHHGEDIEQNHIHPVGKLVLISDFAHNFLDGIIIATSFSINAQVGIATTMAVILHEIPQEIGDFSVLLHAGYSKGRALWLNFLSALSAVLGAAIFFITSGNFGVSFSWLVPIAAGGFIYIAMTDLIPELQKTKGIKYSIAQILALITGVFAMIVLTFLE